MFEDDVRRHEGRRSTHTKAMARIVGLVLALILSSSAPTLASTQLDSCINITSLFKERLVSLGGQDWLAFQLKRDNEVRHLVFTQISKIGSSNDAKWLVATRHSAARPDLYCVQATGNLVELLAPLPAKNSAERFGMPGSTYPRCGERGDIFEGFKVRSWATRELGDSQIIALGKPEPEAPSFVLVSNKRDGHWILLDKQPQSTTCYFDRGEWSDIRKIQINY